MLGCKVWMFFQANLRDFNGTCVTTRICRWINRPSNEGSELFQSPNSLGEPGLILRGYAKEGPEPLVGAAGHGKNTWFEGVIQYGRRYTGEHSWLDSGGHRRLQEVVTTVRPAAWKGAVGTFWG